MIHFDRRAGLRDRKMREELGFPTRTCRSILLLNAAKRLRHFLSGRRRIKVVRPFLTPCLFRSLSCTLFLRCRLYLEVTIEKCDGKQIVTISCYDASVRTMHQTLRRQNGVFILSLFISENVQRNAKFQLYSSADKVRLISVPSASKVCQTETAAFWL